MAFMMMALWILLQKNWLPSFLFPNCIVAFHHKRRAIKGNWSQGSILFLTVIEDISSIARMSWVGEKFKKEKPNFAYTHSGNYIWNLE